MVNDGVGLHLSDPVPASAATASMIWRQKNQLSNGTTTLVPAEGVYLLDGQLNLGFEEALFLLACFLLNVEAEADILFRR